MSEGSINKTMKESCKKVISAALSAVLMLSLLGAPVFAVNAEEYSDLQYDAYTYIGDSISWGYGLDESIDRTDKYSVGKRVPGSFTDLVAGVLEKNGQTTVYPAASSGARISDYRYLLEQGMELENAYQKGKDWYGERHPERTEQLLQMGPEICGWIRQSDLVTVQAGINDVTAVLVNAVSATGLVDLPKLEAIEDADDVLDYLGFALGNVSQDPNIVGNLTETFIHEASEISENIEAVVDHVAALAPDADILLLGYHQAVRGMRVIPGTSYSLVFDLVDRGIDLFNDIYRNAAAKYDNVIYVDIPDATSIFGEGTTVIDALNGGTKNIIKGLHPDAAGHEYIAEVVLDTLEELNAARYEEETAAGYGDVNKGDWSFDAIQYVSERGIMTGPSAGRFDPQGTLTRGMLVQILYALEGKPQSDFVADFSDVHQGDWFYDAVNWAKKNEVAGGYPDQTFRPNEPVTREQLAVMLKAYAGEDAAGDADIDSYADAYAVSDWAKEAVQWAVAEGLIAGREGNKIAPAEYATRAEVAQIMKNFCENIKK